MPTSSGFDAYTVADTLYHACKGFGTDEAAVMGALRSVTSQVDWNSVNDAFRQRHSDMKGGDLRKTLESDLSAAELRQAKGILQSNGVTWDSGGGYVSVGPTTATPMDMQQNALFQPGMMNTFSSGSSALPPPSAFTSYSTSNSAVRPVTEYERWNIMQQNSLSAGKPTPEELGFQNAQSRRMRSAAYGRADFKPVYAHTSPGQGSYRTMSDHEQQQRGFQGVAPAGF